MQFVEVDLLAAGDAVEVAPQHPDEVDALVRQPGPERVEPGGRRWVWGRGRGAMGHGVLPSGGPDGRAPTDAERAGRAVEAVTGGRGRADARTEIRATAPVPEVRPRGPGR
ncbi:hypothetical protein SSCG_03046 [Streptomyces clavuligerus]|nr:hypothetical protein SSCG_03046 [Streptomyces clavuligerus]